MKLLAASAFHKSTKSPPGSQLCLYFTSFFAACTSPLFPRSPRFYIIFCDTFRGCPSVWRWGILTNGQTDTRPSLRPISPQPAQAGALRVGQNARLCHNRLYSNTPHHTIRPQPGNLGSAGRRRARELSGDIFYAKDVPRQAAIPATQPPLLKLPGCSPNSVRAKNLCISPRFTKHSGCFALQMETVSSKQKWKKRGISPNFTTWSCPLATPSLQTR